ncbi:MAG TPA: hypothetical protein VJ904_14885, partial [Tichowtungia sp.]|nr:hypothetical protein [Tichowtungia sp.]
MFYRRLIRWLVLTAACTALAEPREFRLDRECLWLCVTGEPLASVLEHFAAAGVDVQVAPGVQKTVSGEWEGVDAESALDEIISPYDYRLAWRRETGPLGERITLTAIRVFRKG